MEITLRDYFAAHCPESEIEFADMCNQEERCRRRYVWADQMIAARGTKSLPPAPPAPNAKGPTVGVRGGLNTGGSKC